MDSARHHHCSKIPAVLIAILMCAGLASAQTAKPPQAKPPATPQQSRPSAPAPAKALSLPAVVTKGTVNGIALEASTLTLATEDGGTATVALTKATKWTGVAGLADLLVGESVSISSRPASTQDSTAVTTALSVVVDTTKTDRPLLREGTAGETGMVMMGGDWVPFVNLDEIPKTTFICSRAEAAKWHLIQQFGEGAQQLMIGSQRSSLGKVRLTTKIVEDGYERILDLRPVAK